MEITISFGFGVPKIVPITVGKECLKSAIRRIIRCEKWLLTERGGGLVQEIKRRKKHHRRPYRKQQLTLEK